MLEHWTGAARRRLRAAAAAAVGPGAANREFFAPPQALERDRGALRGQEASDWIRALIEQGHPCMVARLGSVELGIVADYLYTQRATARGRLYAYLRNGRRSGYGPARVQALRNNAGFFPPTSERLDDFCRLMLRSMQDVDLLGSWVPGENLVAPFLRHAKVCTLADLEPYYHPDPWSRALRHKTVMVVHPFAASIVSQYAHRRERLFANPDVLPEFKLLTFKAVQSIAGNPTGFASWFEALDRMSDALSRESFDVALIGCGAYGFPLAARIKAMGRQAIHLGGATQVLFGIRGERWDAHPVISGLFNAHWVRPDVEERPANFRAVEGGCYW
jgi:hypothetical protein